MKRLARVLHQKADLEGPWLAALPPCEAAPSADGYGVVFCGKVVKRKAEGSSGLLEPSAKAVLGPLELLVVLVRVLVSVVFKIDTLYLVFNCQPRTDVEGALVNHLQDSNPGLLLPLVICVQMD